MENLQGLLQRSLRVEEYRQQMKLLMIRARISEEEMTTITRFQSGLNLGIRNKVELLPYRNLNELVQLCVTIKQLKRKPSLRKNSISYPKKDLKKEGHFFQHKVNRPLEK
uniref:Retrotransposon gag domain-containing protein n=1 Tax=Cajanus cajan TaxID=3821 RepID=A0A151TP93_CAJCA|nr:hypothetical protein KK1_022533 [Cajanus cajan]